MFLICNQQKVPACPFVPDTLSHLGLCVCLQDVLNGEEGLSDEEKARRKAERRKAKRKVRGDKLYHTKDKNEPPLTQSLLSGQIY